MKLNYLVQRIRTIISGISIPFMIFLFGAKALAAEEVRSGTPDWKIIRDEVVISYDLDGPKELTCEVSVRLLRESDRSFRFAPKTAIGNVGKGKFFGKDNLIHWSYKKDIPKEMIGADYYFEITAKTPGDIQWPFMGQLVARVKLRTRVGMLLPPKLEIETTVKDATGDRILETDESGSLVVSVTNNGGDARDVVIRLEPREFTNGLMVDSVMRLGDIPAGASKDAFFALTATEDSQTGIDSLRISVEELSKTSPVSKITYLSMKRTVGPQLSLTQSWINGLTLGSPNAEIVPGRQTQIDLQIYNAGERKAQDVNLSVSFDSSSSISMKSVATFGLGDIAPADKRLVQFSIESSELLKSDSVEMKVRISEKRKKFSREQKVGMPVLTEKPSKQELAQTSLQNGEIGIALKLFQELAEENPDSASNLYFLATAYADSGLMSQAIENYQKSASLGDVRAVKWLQKNTKEISNVSYLPLTHSPFTGVAVPIVIGFLNFINAKGSIADFGIKLYDALRVRPAIKRSFELIPAGTLKSFYGITGVNPRNINDLNKLRENGIKLVLIGTVNDQRVSRFTLQLVSTETGKMVIDQQFRDSDHSTALDDAVRLFENSQRAVYKSRMVSTR